MRTLLLTLIAFLLAFNILFWSLYLLKEPLVKADKSSLVTNGSFPPSSLDSQLKQLAILRSGLDSEINLRGSHG